MKKETSFLLVALCQSNLVTAQMTTITDSSFIVSLNQQIDNLVIEQNTAALDSMYASDFVFSHGSGKIEGKQGWFISVAKGNFLTRQHDSVTVELHEGIAIVMRHQKVYNNKLIAAVKVILILRPTSLLVFLFAPGMSSVLFPVQGIIL